MTDSETFVIVGAGHAGGRAAEAMRMLGFEGEIILVGAEPHLPYERPPLSKELLQTEGGEGFMLIRDQDYYDENRIDCRLGSRATAIDRGAKTVTLQDSTPLSYDKLLLTTGGDVRRLDLPGADLSNVFYLRTLDDSRAIESRLGAAPRVVIVGGGFIGLEVAASARRRGCAVTVLEAADRLMGRAVLPEVSQAFLDLHDAHGVDIRLDCAIGHFEGTGSVERAITAAGEALPADLVVIGVGIVPDTALAEAAGLAVDNGLVVDEFCRTSDPAIFAAGDVTRHFSPLCGRPIRLEAWQNAQNQAIAAARIMCGEETPFSEVPWMWSDQFDANLQIAGMPDGWDTVLFRGDVAARDFIGFQMQDGEVVGAMSLNRPRDMRFARRLIGTGRRIDAGALTDEAIPLRDLAKG